MGATLDARALGGVVAVAALATALLGVLHALGVPWPVAVVVALAAYAGGLWRSGLLRSLKEALT